MMVWMADETGAVTFVNRRWLAFTGRHSRDELGNGWTASVHPDDLPPLLDAYHRAVIDQRPLLLEYRLRRSDGLYRRICDCALPLHEDDGEFAGYVGTCVDVTGQREGTAALERTVEHLRLVATHADEMIYRLRIRPHRHLEYISPGVARVLGLSPADVMDAPLKAIARIHPEDRARLREVMVAVVDPATRVTLRWCLPDGRIVWAEHRHLPVFDEDGNLSAIDGVARDVTRQRELEQERDAQIAMLDGLIAHMSDGVFAQTGDNQVAVVNAAFSRIFDLPPTPWSAGAAPMLRRLARERLEQAGENPPADGGDPLPAGELRLKDGRILEQQQFSVPLADRQVIRVWQFRDITLRKNEEEELRTSRHRLRNLSAHLEAVREEERRALARTLHDEVGQLLTGIRLEIAGAVERFRQAGTPSSFPIVDRLQAAVGLIDLSVASVQRVATALRPPILDHLELLSAIRWEAALFRRRTGIRCRVSARSLRIESRSHTTVLHRILLEALTNVARHANAGTVWIFFRQRRNGVVMEVRDNGKGIPESALTSPGSMGLLGMRERALAAGGELRISRRPAGGTSIVVTLPLSSEDRARTGSADV
jgi:PAS domain S-box-containing protein